MNNSSLKIYSKQLNSGSDAEHSIYFTKMQGAGNDFIVIDGIHQSFKPSVTLIQQWADRHTGIGFDQLLIVEPSCNADFFYRIFNADGAEVSQCGNGARCLARFLLEENLTDKKQLTIETLAGMLELQVEDDQQITVNMGIPNFEPAKIPFLAAKQTQTYSLVVADQNLEICALSLGNPHCIFIVPDIHQVPITTLGPLLNKHPSFPEETNVGFMEIKNSSQINLRVYERGVGETLACGSGACAAVCAGRLLGLLDKKVQVCLPGGELVVSWKGLGEPVYLTGPAVTVFRGKLAY